MRDFDYYLAIIIAVLLFMALLVVYVHDAHQSDYEECLGFCYEVSDFETEEKMECFDKCIELREEIECPA